MFPLLLAATFQIGIQRLSASGNCGGRMKFASVVKKKKNPRSNFEFDSLAGKLRLDFDSRSQYCYCVDDGRNDEATSASTFRVRFWLCFNSGKKTGEKVRRKKGQWTRWERKFLSFHIRRAVERENFVRNICADLREHVSLLGFSPRSFCHFLYFQLLILHRTGLGPLFICRLL